MERIKKNDTVKVISGKDSKKTGKVIEILSKKGKVLVKDIALVTKHFKPRRQGETAGIKKIESFLEVSNVMPICASCNKPTRVGSKKISDGKSVRICCRCKEQF